MKQLILLISFALFLFSSACREDDSGTMPYIQNLGGTWLLQGMDVSVEVRVPGYVIPALVEAGLYADPFKDEQEQNFGKVLRSEWVFSRSFIPDPKVLSHEHYDLVFEGLDTYAEVFLNGSSVLKAENMHRSYRIDVKEWLKPGTENELRIEFHPALVSDSLLAKNSPYTLPDQRGFSRKAAYMYGWDWGPALPDAGIWKDVRLEGWTGMRIEQVSVWMDSLFADTAFCTLKVRAWGDMDHLPSYTLHLKDGSVIPLCWKDYSGGERFSWEFFPPDQYLSFKLPDPDLWQPHGSGAFRYHATLEVSSDEVPVGIARDISFGLREIRLINEPDSIGASFHFELNGERVFILGANYIPQHSFPSIPTDDDYRRLLCDAKESGFNMLRVWGGGIYERDIFYELCDSLGIMVWQDFMFACNMYPGDARMLAEVFFESNEQVNRLAGHPCIALWCGNNEVKNGFEDWGWETQLGWSKDEREILAQAMDTLFNHILPREVGFYSGGVPYWASSPLWGWGHPEHLTEGDSHHWGVWWGEQPIRTFEKDIPRFMSEYGMQAYPSMAVLGSMSADADSLLDPGIQNHQKHPRGEYLIRKYMEDLFGIIPEDPQHFIYLSQLTQAITLETAIRAQMASPRCSGTLYWQLNDCWPSISWSTIDFNGEWKAGQYFIHRLYNHWHDDMPDPTLDAEFGRILQKPQFEIEVRNSSWEGQIEYDVILSTDVPAAYIWLIAENGGRFSDNFFHIAPGEDILVEWFGKDGVKAPGKISIISLNDIYSHE